MQLNLLVLATYQVMNDVTLICVASAITEPFARLHALDYAARLMYTAKTACMLRPLNFLDSFVFIDIAINTSFIVTCSIWNGTRNTVGLLSFVITL